MLLGLFVWQIILGHLLEALAIGVRNGRYAVVLSGVEVLECSLVLSERVLSLNHDGGTGLLSPLLCDLFEVVHKRLVAELLLHLRFIFQFITSAFQFAPPTYQAPCLSAATHLSGCWKQ